MSEELEATATLAYEAYRASRQGTVEGGLPMPVWEHLSVPERDAWLAVAAAVAVPPEPPVLRSSTLQEEGAPSVRWTQHDLEQMTVAELRELGTAQDLSVPSGASKQHVIDALLADHDRREG